MANRRSTFGRVFQRKGRTGFYIRVRDGARELVRWAGPDRKTATEFLGEIMRTMAREDLLGEKAVPAVTLAEFERQLVEHLRTRHASTTLEVEQRRLVDIRAWFGTKALRDIGPGDVQEFLTYLRATKGHSIATANRYASLLSVAFRLAVAKNLARTNPARGIPRPREEIKAIPFVSAADVDRLVAEARDQRLGGLIRVLSDTGLRRSEALALEWRDVDRVRGCVLVRRSKNRKPRQIELTNQARDAFEHLHELRGAVPIAGPDLVWPEWSEHLPQAISSRFRTVARRAGFKSLRLHDLRHGFCSRLAQAGVPLPTIGALAGHTSVATTQRYACHLPEGATLAAIRAMENNERCPPKTRKKSS